MTVDAGYRRGLDLHLYRNTGTFGTPVWLEITNCRDLERGLKRTRIDSSTRGFAGIATKVPGLIEITPKWEMVYDESDTSLAAIQAAFWATTPAATQIEFAWSDGTITGMGIRYLRAVCSVFDMGEAEPLDGMEMVSVEVEPTYNANPPTINTA